MWRRHSNLSDRNLTASRPFGKHPVNRFPMGSLPSTLGEEIVLKQSNGESGMPLKIHRGSDIDINILKNSAVALVGYGNQGRAHALNLRDSGLDVVIGQRPGKSFDRAVSDSFKPHPVPSACKDATLIIVSLPDESAAAIYEAEIRPTLRAGQTLGFVHGFNISFGFITPPADVDVVMVAPKGPGTLLRSSFEQGRGIPALMAVHQDATGNATKTTLAWATGIGCARAAIIETTFAEETETDLFGEQVVLCGGLTALCKAAFETLVEAGYTPEFAYLECVHELKQVADLLYTRGLSGMRDAISNTAEYGDLTRGPRIIDDHVRAEMRRVLAEVRSGAFAKEWIAEHRSGGQKFQKLYTADVGTAFEKAGETVRSWMPK